jgi:energy-coupling factor transporter ATP-binding protein EcfA2
MANDPDLILADEPTSTPDSKTGERVMHLFQNLNQDQRKTIVLSTHNAKLSIETNRVLTMSDGRLIQANISLIGINENYFDIQSVHFKQERTLSKQDNDSLTNTGGIIGILLWICFCDWRLLGILSGEQGRET